MSGKICPKLGNGKRKKRIFPLKKFRRSAKNIETGRKISQFRMEKGRKNYSDEAKKSQKTDDPDEKKQQIFSQADGKIQKCTGKEAEKFIESSEKSMKNIRPIGINSIIDGRSG